MIGDKWNIKLLEPGLVPWRPQKESRRQIAVLMSGGVDSSVTASVLKEQGWDVLGITMKIPVSCERRKRGCCGADAAFVCNQLGISHYFVDVSEAFEELIIKPFRQSYADGQTPNPCADCNRLLKFSLLWDFIQEKFAVSFLATGHYARVSEINDQVYLGKAEDKSKDQSYFLYGIASAKLARLVLPLGGLTKDKVRLIAADLGLTVAEKPESMELCFADEGDYRMALSDDKVNQGGDITDMLGRRIGRHKGISNYTLGQRKGIGFAGGKPLYVGKIDAIANTIALGTREEVSCNTIIANRINILIADELAVDRQFFGKIRSYGEPRLCKVVNLNEAEIKVEFAKPQFAPCCGQKLVLYNSDDNIVAGGTICG